MKGLKKVLAAAAAAAIALPALAGCGGGGDTAQVSDDGSEQVTLKWVFVGPGEQEDSQKVWDKFNEVLANYLPNTTVEFECITSADYAEKWKLMSASQENLDIVWHGWMLPYVSEVKKGSYMELDELAAAIPDHLFDYILFDACFMGSVEVLYALRDKADYIISSPAEVISDGFPYAQIMEPLCRENPDLETVCETYYRYYAEHDVPQYHAATVSLVKTSALETLASATAALYTAALSADSRIFPFMDSGQLQPLDRYARHFVFDMGSIADELYRQAVVSAEQYAEWQDAFSQAVIYEAHTPWFFSLQLDKCCGLSSYVPLAQYADLNAFYVQQEWYHRVFSE